MTEVLRFILGALVFVGALTGFAAFFHRKFNVAPEALPLVCTATMTILVFLFGVVGLLQLGVYLVIAIGVLLLAWHVYLSAVGRYRMRDLFCPGTVFFLGLCAVLVFRLWSITYTHYDNFSHWGLIVQEMVELDSLPHQNTLVMFDTYPPGSACFIYLFCKLAGYTEGIALIAQGVLVSAALTPLFIGKRKFGAAVPALLIGCVALLAFLRYDNGSLHIDNLLVDGLQGFCCAAALILAWDAADEPTKLEVSLIPVLALMVLLKFNGLVFFVLILVATAILLRKKRCSMQTPSVGEVGGNATGARAAMSETTSKTMSKAGNAEVSATNSESLVKSADGQVRLMVKRNRASIMRMTLLPVAMLLIWIVHIVFAYPDKYGLAKMGQVMVSIMSVWAWLGVGALIVGVGAFLWWAIKHKKHWRRPIFIIMCVVLGVVLVSALVFAASRRSAGFLSSFPLNFLRALFDPTSTNFWVYFGVNALLLLFLATSEKNNRKPLKKILVYNNLLVGVYVLFLLVFYLALLAEEEAAYMAAFSRYFGVIIIVFMQLGMFGVGQVLHAGRLAWLKVCAAALVILVLCAGNTTVLVTGPDYSQSERHSLSAVFDDAAQHIPRDARVAMYTGQRGRRDLYYYLMVNEFSSRNCMVLDYAQPEKSPKQDTMLVRKYDYLVVTQVDESLRQNIAAAGIVGQIEDGVTVYKVVRQDNKVNLVPCESP